jgi:hypothetical protein
MWEVIMVALSALASLTIVGRAAEGGLFNSALTRTVAGGSAAVATQTFLYGYTNAIIFTAGVWVNNLIAYRQAIV